MISLTANLDSGFFVNTVPGQPSRANTSVPAWNVIPQANSSWYQRDLQQENQELLLTLPK